MKNILLLFIYGISFSVLAQEGQVNKANDQYSKLAFIDAQEIYLKVVESGYENAEILAKLGDTYYFNDDLEKAFKWYNRLFVVATEDAIAPEYFFRYAQSLKSVRRYPEADALMSRFKDYKGFDSRSQKYSDEPNYLQIIDFQSGRFEVVNTAAINTPTADFGPRFDSYRDQVVFSSGRDTFDIAKRVHSWSNQAFLDLYTADKDSEGKLTNAVKMDKRINSIYHESTPTFTKDGKTMYFTRNNYTGQVYRQDINGVNKLKIYRSEKQGKRWSEPVELPFCSDEFSTAHPALSADDKKLYFASDMPGSTGANDKLIGENSDIWVVDILDNGNYSTPRNLKEINTAGRETFPFVSKNNTLYFASSGHPGLGGLDIFAASINNDGSLSKVMNIGKPVNTVDDDFSFIVDDDTKIGYFSSNRPGGTGDDDIYRFIQLEDLRKACDVVLTGTVTDEKTGLPMEGATVKVMDANNTKINELVTEANGKYVFKLECDKQYFVRVEKDDYTSDEDLFTTPAKSGFVDVPLTMNKSRIPVVDCDDLGPLLDIKNIYFDFDKFNIRKDAAMELAKIKAFMELYPQTTVDIRSHTDSRAPDRYNDVLSERRAQSTRNWLIKNGIAASRLTAKGYGERQLVNRCSNGVPCSSEDHQKNRRSEFIVSGLGDYSNCK